MELYNMNIKEMADEIHNILCDMENEDENVAKLEKAMNFFCGNWDKCEGFKHALHLTIDDQIENHADEQDPKDFRELLDILNGAI